MSRRTARFLVWFALTAQVAFVAAWIVAGALEPSYSHLDTGVSTLGGDQARHPWIVNTAIVLFGLSFAALGLALRAVLPRRNAATAAVWLFAVAGIGMIASALLTVDCDLSKDHCRDLFDAGRLSAHNDAHLWLSLIVPFFLVATPFALARALWPGPVAALALAAGIEGVAIGALSWVLFGVGVPDGLTQRIGLFILHAWVFIVGVGILYALRRAPAPGRLVPLRPRDFFAQSWRGEGELLLWPYSLWRRAGNRFEARREATWISDRVWRVDDVSRFADGREQRRLTFAELVDDDRVRLTAGDLPDGAELVIEDGGYRMVPFRMDFPVGPLKVPMRVHDISHVEGDGTLVNAFEARALITGLPIARLIFRVRPVAAGAPQAATASSANR
ncbi:MAG TPA: DUF998 domain-containing protein [Thermoleophilaceae bacterium]